MIAASKEGNLGEILRDMKKHTDNAIVKATEENPGESERELFIAHLYKAGKESKRHTNFRFGKKPIIRLNYFQTSSSSKGNLYPYESG